MGRVRSEFPNLPILIFSDHGFGQGGDPKRHNDSPSTFLATTWPIENRTYGMIELVGVLSAAMSLPL